MKRLLLPLLLTSLFACKKDGADAAKPTPVDADREREITVLWSKDGYQNPGLRIEQLRSATDSTVVRVLMSTRDPYVTSFKFTARPSQFVGRVVVSYTDTPSLSLPSNVLVSVGQSNRVIVDKRFFAARTAVTDVLHFAPDPSK